MLHPNSQSPSKNLDQLSIYLATLNHIFHTIAVSETWATKINCPFLQITGYNCLMKCHADHRDGGVALYIHDSPTYRDRYDFNAHANQNFECVFDDLSHISFGTKIVRAIYRTPKTDIDAFITGFELLIDNVCNFKHEYLIASDNNIDLLNLQHKSHNGSHLLVNAIYSNHMVPPITRPIRFTYNSSSLNDNIFYKLS